MLKNDYPCIFEKISRKTAISSLLVAHRDGFESSFANMEPLLNWKDPRLCIASWPDETLRVSHAVQYRDQGSLSRIVGKKRGKKKIPETLKCNGMTKVTSRALWEGETWWMPQRPSSYLQIPQARA